MLCGPSRLDSPPPAAGSGGSGDVVGPAVAVDNQLALFDGVTGKLIKAALATANPAVAGLMIPFTGTIPTDSVPRYNGALNLVAAKLLSLIDGSVTNDIPAGVPNVVSSESASLGSGNTSSGNRSFTAGNNNLASGSRGIALGDTGLADLFAMLGLGTGFRSCQIQLLQFVGETTDAVEKELTQANQAAQFRTLEDGDAYTILDITVGKRLGTADSCGQISINHIMRQGATTAIVDNTAATPGFGLGLAYLTTLVRMDADDPNDRLAVFVTGNAGQTWLWNRFLILVRCKRA